MAQNIFMASMYFFVPINKVKHLDKHRIFHPIECTSQFQSVSSICEYCEIEEKHQDFYFNSSITTNIKRERLIKLKVYIFRYKPIATDKKSHPKHFLVIGTGIDKLFEGYNTPINTNDYCDCTDLVMLKQSFYSKHNKSNKYSGLYYPQNDSTIFHREWLNKLVHDFDSEASAVIKFDASITDIRTVALTASQNISDKAKLQAVFEYCYVNSPCLSYNKALDVDVDRLAYGILVGNENFANLPDDFVTSFKRDSYSNNLSERIFAASNSLLYIRTHHPYLDIKKDVISNLSMTIKDLDERTVYELCHSLYIKEELIAIRNQVNMKSKSEIVKEASDKLAYLLNLQLFNFHEADSRANILWGGLGITKLSQETDQYVTRYLTNNRFAYSKKQNRWMGCLTVVTIVIGFLALIVTLWPCQIREHLEEEMQFGDITYSRWKGYLPLLANILILFPIFMFFAKLEIPFNKWLSIKINNFLNYIHKKATEDE